MKNVDLTLRLLAKDQASGELQKVQRSASTVGDSFKKMGAVAAGALAGVSIASFAKDSIAAASDLNESISKTGVIFGESAGAIKSFAEGAAENLGLSQRAALDAASTFATFGKAAGLTGNDLTAFSTQLTTLSADLASFYNTSPEQAITAIGAALRGESEPIRQYGVLLDDATLRQRAFEMGLISTTKNALTPQQKALAAQAEIMAQTSDAQGDFARTSDGLANKQRILAAEVENAQAKIGELLLPAMSDLVDIATESIDALEPFIDQLTGIGDAAGEAGISIEGLGKSMADMMSSSVVGTNWLDMFGPGVGSIFYGITQTTDAVNEQKKRLKELGYELDETTGKYKLVTDGKNRFRDVTESLTKNLGKEADATTEATDALAEYNKEALKRVGLHDEELRGRARDANSVWTDADRQVWQDRVDAERAAAEERKRLRAQDVADAKAAAEELKRQYEADVQAAADAAQRKAEAISAALKSATEQAVAFAKQISDAMLSFTTLQMGKEGTGAAGIQSQMQMRVDKLRRFGTVLGRLKKAGLNNVMLQQIIAAGPDDGLAMADALLKDGIGNLNDLQAEADRLAQRVAGVGLASEYGAAGAGQDMTITIPLNVNIEGTQLEAALVKVKRRNGRLAFECIGGRAA